MAKLERTNKRKIQEYSLYNYADVFHVKSERYVYRYLHARELWT